MLRSAREDGCVQCPGRIIDVGEELVCSSYGRVTAKEVVEAGGSRVPQAIDYTTHSLGSYLGPVDYGYGERFSPGFSKSSSTFKYLKTISDFAYRDGAALYNCAKLVERVCEKLSLPKTVVCESVSIAREVMEMRRQRGEVTIASVSAFSIINACKRLGVTSAGVREVMEAHRNLGYRVKASIIIQISIDSPVKTRPRRAEEYLGTVLARLPRALIKSGGMPAGYTNRLHDTARVALEQVDGPSRGGHNPRAVAATAIYAAEVALAETEGRKKVFSQREVAECAQMAEYTVREQYVEIFKSRMAAIGDALRARESRYQTQPTGTYRIPLSPSGTS
jgi:transcription initiation factor TFIIIB Brf1 subunit/transcription initiation factor TFIIB